jgi:hypothetical protein
VYYEVGKTPTATLHLSSAIAQEPLGVRLISASAASESTWTTSAQAAPSSCESTIAPVTMARVSARIRYDRSMAKIRGAPEGGFVVLTGAMRSLTSLMGLGGALFLAVGLSATVAKADVVAPEPTDCLPGSVGSTSHAGQYCTVVDCSTDATQCGTSASCQSVSFCIKKITGSSGYGEVTVNDVVGVCGANNTCASGTCTPVKACIPAAAGGSNGSGGSSATGGKTAAGGSSESTAGAPIGTGGGSAASAGAAGADRGETGDSGCGCRSAASSGGNVTAFGVLAGCTWLLLRRRRNSG